VCPHPEWGDAVRSGDVDAARPPTSSGRAGRIAAFAPSKFLGPTPSSRHVERRALRARLDGGEEELRLVIGSPGAGKTSLLSEWFHGGATRRACWLNVDEGDRDPVRFWTAFIAAVSRCRPGFADECLDLLRLDTRVDHELLERLLDAIGRLDEPVTIVIDDFHLAGAEVHAHLRLLLGRGVKPLQLVVATRTEPDIGLQRLRLAGRVGELREADLRFDQDEAGALLERLGVLLPPESFESVMQRTEGWAAGLHLAALALRESDQPGEVVERLTGTNQVIAHYLWSEVYSAQTPDVQRFLLDTCVVDELTPPLAAALSPGNPMTLLDIEAAHLLLQRVDADGTAFRYHHLLRDMLRFRLRATDTAHESVLHERAADWYSEHDDLVLAFRHRWRAGQRAAALRSMHGTVLDIVYESTLPVITEAERSLTDDDILAAPGPAASFAVALLVNGLAVEADRLARRVHMLAGQHLDDDDARQLDAVRATSAFVVGDTQAAIGFGRGRAPAAVTDAWSFVIGCVVARAHVWEGDLELAERWLTNLMPALPTALERLEVAGTTAQLQLAAGELSAAFATSSGIVAELDREGRDSLRDDLLARAVLGAVLLDRGELSSAERLLREVSEARAHHRVPAVVLAKLTLSRLWTAKGNPDAALIVLEDAYGLIQARPPRSGVLDRVREQHTRVLIATESLDEAGALLPDIGLDRRRHLLAAELALSRGDVDRAGHHLKQFDKARSSVLREELEAALAWLSLDLAAGRPATDRAATVLDLATRESFVLPLVEAGSASLAALQQQAHRLPCTPYLETVMRQPLPLAVGCHARGQIDALTERERTVLSYLATSMSYREIAAELVVSLNTVKTHVKNIKQKLNAHSREAAVTRAHEMHYL
jgi:LuxR family transcriptional regulator, maltose regulon positive regulatory protein